MNGPRAFAMIPELMATCAADTLFVNLYGESVSKVLLAGGEVILRQQTNYPEQGSVELTVNPSQERIRRCGAYSGLEQDNDGDGHFARRWPMCAPAVI